jgi:hypothetical protein
MHRRQGDARLVGAGLAGLARLGRQGVAGQGSAGRGIAGLGKACIGTAGKVTEQRRRTLPPRECAPFLFCHSAYQFVALDLLEPDRMDELGRERYRLVEEVIRELE